MKIPKQIKVAGHSILIRRKPKASEEKYRCMLGLAYLPTNRIEVFTTYDGSGPLPEEKQAEVFLHEVIHHIDDKYSIDLKEKQVRQLSAGLFQVMRDNKLNFSDPTI